MYIFLRDFIHWNMSVLKQKSPREPNVLKLTFRYYTSYCTDQPIYQSTFQTLQKWTGINRFVHDHFAISSHQAISNYCLMLMIIAKNELPKRR